MRYADRRLNFLEKKRTVARTKIIATIAMRTDISRKECTMDEMIELNLNYLDEFNKDSEVKYTVEEARKTMKEYFHS